MKRAIYWFTHDLRLADNPGLALTATRCDEMAFVYCVEPTWFRPNRYGLLSLGERRWEFLYQSLKDLAQQLEAYGHTLLVLQGDPVVEITRLVRGLGAGELAASAQIGVYERRQWAAICKALPEVTAHAFQTHTLFERGDLPFELDALPASFTDFRKRVEAQLDVPPPHGAPGDLPAQIAGTRAPWPELPARAVGLEPGPAGGESAAQQHLQDYFRSAAPATYKETRNALAGWDHSTKFSRWLAHGNVSPRRIMAQLRRFEAEHDANESTYWIYFELLWREYFQWYALAYGATLFAFGGIKRRAPLTTFYAERFQKWCLGRTPYSLVNACMHELNATGYMSNRGRQLVASCFVNELQLDWRFGAAYFEQQLVDYDVGSNWGNWQYLAGVGADPRGKRHFDLAKQARTYDPDSDFVRAWDGHPPDAPLDSVDAVDWPVL